MKVKNKDVLQLLLENLEWDGYNYWFPDEMLGGKERFHDPTKPTLEEMKAAIVYVLSKENKS